MYLDDMLIASNDSKRLDVFEEKLMNTFEMSDLEEPVTVLSMNIERNRKPKPCLLIRKITFKEF